jgi:hypothetical protein
MKTSSRPFKLALSALTILAISLSGCKKDKKDESSTLLVHNLSVESIIGVGGLQSTTNKSFINLYDGVTYSKAEAEPQSSKVDFAYNYHGGGCSTCRFFENVKNMSTRTGYVSSFSTITNSTITNAEQSYKITSQDFDAIRTSIDIDKLFTDKKITLSGSADVTNRTTDAAVGKIFAFIDKQGHKGFFQIADYIANVPNGDKATLQLTVKVSK